MEKKALISKSKSAKRDLELVLLAKGGDDRAIDHLFKIHYPYIYGLLVSKVKNKSIAEDLTIEALTKAFMQLEKYDPQYAFSTWLKRIVINHHIDFVRKKKLETYSLQNATENKEDAYLLNSDMVAASPEDIYIKKQRASFVKNFVESMKEHHSVLIELRFFKELTYEEIADTLGVPIGTVKARLHRAKHVLADLMLSSRPSM
jgi:RNA polymerase sigma-70 factor (ECF subfamily)